MPPVCFCTCCHLPPLCSRAHALTRTCKTGSGAVTSTAAQNSSVATGTGIHLHPSQMRIAQMPHASALCSACAARSQRARLCFLLILQAPRQAGARHIHRPHPSSVLCHADFSPGHSSLTRQVGLTRTAFHAYRLSQGSKDCRRFSSKPRSWYQKPISLILLRTAITHPVPQYQSAQA